MTSSITKEEYIYKVNEFLKQNKNKFTEEEYNYIKSNAEWGARRQDTPDILRQIYDEVGLLDQNNNVYIAFTDLLENEFNINQNIVEIGGGYLPRLGKHIALRQKTGTITVYDHKLITNTSNLSNLILKKEKFTSATPLTGKTLIIGFMPCDATNLLLEVACQNNIDFMIGLCEGGDRKGYEYIETADEWVGYVKYLAKRGIEKYDMGTLEEFSLEKYGDPYPVIYNKRKDS